MTAAASPWSGVKTRPGTALPTTRDPARRWRMPADTAGSPRLLGQNIVVVDDCRLSRENLGAALGRTAGTPYLAWDLTSLVSVLDGLETPVVLLNIATRDNRMLLHAVTRVNPDAQVIVLGALDDNDDQLLACAAAGATAIHSRSESLDELLTLVEKVSSTGTFISSQVAAALLRRVASVDREPLPITQDLDLTTREVQILRLIQRGLTNREIAAELEIAVHTVKNHVHRLLSKLGVTNRNEAAARFGSLGTSAPSEKN
ncbi:helix-turn-helix transcriptional regulator [Mycolicibacterium thermoresistibile]